MSTSGNFKHVSAVVVTFNGEAWIQSCLSSLKKSVYPIQIIVVDNGSTDSTVSIIQREFSDVVLFVNDHNVGFGQANNIGISSAIRNGAEFIFLLNQDATMEVNTIQSLVAELNLNSSYGLLSPVHYNGSGYDFDEGFKKYILKKYSPAELSLWKERPINKIYDVNFVNAAAWLIRVNALEKAGGFAPLFFHYGEDRDFVNRLRYFDIRVGVLPTSEIYHFRESRSMEIEKWSYQKILRYYYVGCLTRCADINQSLMRGFFSGMIWCFKEIIVLTIKGGLKGPFIFIRVFFTMLFSISEIMKHRKSVRFPSPYQFLSCA